MVSSLNVEPSPAPSPRETKTPDEGMAFQSTVLLRAGSQFVLGASLRVFDGHLLVSSDERLPIGTSVAIALTLPGSEVTVQLDGHIADWHASDEHEDLDRPGMLVAIDSDD